MKLDNMAKEENDINSIKPLLTELTEFKEDTADLMLVISWNTDQTDVDLHVVEPTGEECFYSHRNTKMGGYISQDVTEGYGPEMYVLPNAEKGDYEVKVKYFSPNQSRASAKTKVFASIYKNWGQPNEKVINKVVLLKSSKETQTIMTVGVE